MKECMVCGNEIEASAWQCSFCGSHQQPLRKSRKGAQERVRTVNVKTGLPPVEEALLRLEAALNSARQEGVRVVRVIHGWGSGGSEGKLREACRAYLNRKKAEGRIRMLFRGEEYGRENGLVKELLGRCGELRKDERTDSGNPGITIVVL